MTRTEKTPEELFDEFTSASRDQWADRTAQRPSEDPARLAHGLVEVAIAVVAPEKHLSLRELRDKLRDFASDSYAWGQLFSGEHNRARPMGKAIETLYPEQCDQISDRDLHYYWRTTIDGKLYLLRPFGRANAESSHELDILEPISCVARALGFAAKVCEAWGHESTFHFSCRLEGLRGLQLSSQNPNLQMSLGNEHRCCNNEMTLDTVRVSVEEAKVEAAAILLQLLSPLFEQFNYFPLSKSLVIEVLKHIQR